MVAALKKVAIEAFLEIEFRFDALNFEEVHRKDVITPILDQRYTSEFLKFIGNGEILKFLQFEIDGLERSQNESLAPQIVQDGVQVADVVPIRFVNFSDLSIDQLLVFRSQGNTPEEIFDVQCSSRL